MLIKLLTEAGKGRENSSAKRHSLLRPEDGYLQLVYIIKGDMSVCLFVCLLPMAGQMAGPIKTKLGIGTHVDARSVLVKVKVIWCHLVNANKTPYRGPQGPREFERSLFRPEDGYLQLILK